VNSTNGVADLRPTGTAALRREQVIDRPAGSVYTRSRAELHTAAPLEPGLVASLVPQLSHAPEPADVYCTAPAQRDSVGALSARQLGELLGAVAEAIR
jgi:hypothetical protein